MKDNKKRVSECVAVFLLLLILFTGKNVVVEDVKPVQNAEMLTISENTYAYASAGVTRTIGTLLEASASKPAVGIEQRESEMVRESYYDETEDIEPEPEVVEPEIRYEEVPAEKTMYVCVDYLNLRTDANVNSDVIDVLSYGDNLQVIGEMNIYVDDVLTEHWSHVNINGYSGYVNSDYIIDEAPYIDMGNFTITYYCPCVICCGWDTGITASGVSATAGITIAADESIPFGTELIIDGHVYTVQDRGGAIKGNHIDIYCNTHEEALSHAVHSSEVYMKIDVD